VGPGQFDIPLGYRDLLIQTNQLLSDLSVTYVDLLLIHWPTQVIPQSSDPYCRAGAMYDEKECRLQSWRAMVHVFNNNLTRAIGVSNYNISQLQEIIDAGLPLPSLNQIPFHLYRSSANQELIMFCRQHNIMFSGYSPLGVVDYHTFPPPMSWTPMADPDVMTLANKYHVTPAQILLQWQYAIGIPTNPRTQNRAHMIENLNSYNFTLSQSEIDTLNGKPQDLCSIDPSFYECANVTTQPQQQATPHKHTLSSRYQK